MSSIHRRHSIDDSYQVSVHLAICHPFIFHILIFSSENLQQNELELGRKHLWKVLSKERTTEKIFLEINQSETRIACGGHV
jgi:hypothetical protein